MKLRRWGLTPPEGVKEENPPSGGSQQIRGQLAREGNQAGLSSDRAKWDEHRSPGVHEPQLRRDRGWRRRLRWPRAPSECHLDDHASNHPPTIASSPPLSEFFLLVLKSRTRLVEATR